MSYTVAQLTTFYENATIGIAPSASDALLLQAYSEQDQAGTITDAQTLADVLVFAQDKTDVALSTYQFFTGASPTIAGLQFLVNGTTNPNDLGSAYYTGFDKENRYYNFAINLATGSGAGATAFAAAYSGVTFNQAVAGAYEQIVGTVNVGATAAAAAIASIEGDQAYFAAIAASRAPTANQDLATKAIMIGYILEEAQKANVGYYAQAVDGFETQLALTGTATTGNLIALYDGRTIGLTTGTDNITGSAYADTISGAVNGNATTTTLTTGDSINGGGGADVLNIADLGTGGVFNVNGVTFTVTAVPTVSVTSAEGVDVNSSAWTGTTALNVSSTEMPGAQTFTAAATTAITLTETDATAGANAGGLVTVNGGSSVTVNETMTNATTGTTATTGAITVNGGAGTTSVTLNQQATTGTTAIGSVTEGAIIINDVNAGSTTKAGVIASVTLSNFAGGAAINDNGLTSLTLSGKGGTVTVTDALNTASPPPVTTLGLNLNGLSSSGASIVDFNNELTTLNVALGASSSLQGFTDTGLKTLNLSGTGTLSLGGIGASVTTLTVTGAAGLGGAGAALSLAGTGIVAFAPTSTGTINVQLATTQTFVGGAGTDIVTLTGDQTKAVTAGSATNNEVILSGAGATFTAANTFTNVTGFEILGVNSGSSGQFDLSKLPSVHAIDVQGAGAAGVTFTKIAAGTTLSIDGPVGGNVIFQAADSTGAADSATLNVGTATETAGIVTGNQVTLLDNVNFGIGTVTINSEGVANATTPYVNTLTTLNDSELTSLTFTGANGTIIGTLTDNASIVSITNSSGGAATVSGWTTTQLTSLTLNGGVALGLADSAGTGITINGGTDNSNVTLNLTHAGAFADTISLGNGTNVVNDTGAVGTESITVGSGANMIAAGTLSNLITVGATGTKAESVVLQLAAANVVTFGAHTGVDNVTVAAHGATPTAVITGLNAAAGSADTITFASDAAAGMVSDYSTANINAYATANNLDATQLSTSIAAVLSATGDNLALHGVGEFTFQGNTYLVEQAAAAGTAIGAGDTVVELTGVQTVTVLSIAAGGVLALHG